MDHAALEDAFASHRARVDQMFATGEWSAYADEFSPDATYRRPGHPEIVGREAIRAWICEYVARFPATEIAALDVIWHSVDPRRDAILYEVRSTMRDPGDGSTHCASTVTTLFYGEDGLCRSGVDVNNPRAYKNMFHNWTRVAQRHGLVLPENLGYLAPVTAPTDLSNPMVPYSLSSPTPSSPNPEPQAGAAASSSSVTTL